MSADQRTSTLPPSVAFDRNSIHFQGSNSFISPLTSSSTPQSVSHQQSSFIMDAHTKFNPQSNLLSPDQMPYESFNRASPEAPLFANMKPRKSMSMAISQILSPPVSPQTKVVQPHERTVATNDPILYGGQDGLSQELDTPLFPEEEEADPHVVVDAHMSARALRKKQFRELPPRDDYVLALEFKSQVHKLWAQDQRRWYAREMAYLKEDEKLRTAYRAKHNFHKLAPAPTTKTTIPIIRKIKAPPKPAGPRKPQTTKPTNRSTATPERQHVRNTTTTTREDRDFNSLLDYSPPIETLPSRSNSMKVDWKGAPIDLSTDPNRHRLHPDELYLAANLRLDCATYLTSKRRIFIGVIAKYREGGEFKKTHCQQACKIDVNKASKLWEAYKKVDWFNRKYFERHL